MSSTRRKYTREFKIEAAKLSYNSDKPAEKIAGNSNINREQIYIYGKIAISTKIIMKEEAFPDIISLI